MPVPHEVMSRDLEKVEFIINYAVHFRFLHLAMNEEDETVPKVQGLVIRSAPEGAESEPIIAEELPRDHSVQRAAVHQTRSRRLARPFLNSHTGVPSASGTGNQNISVGRGLMRYLQLPVDLQSRMASKDDFNFRSSYLSSCNPGTDKLGMFFFNKAQLLQWYHAHSQLIKFGSNWRCQNNYVNSTETKIINVLN
jgi:hypothetical protein